VLKRRAAAAEAAGARRRRPPATDELANQLGKCMELQTDHNKKVPDLFIQGTGSALPGILAVERVADLDKWEGSLFVVQALNIDMKGEAIAKYLGLGVKGDLRGWSLYNAYVGLYDAVYIGYQVALKFCASMSICQAGLSGMVSFRRGPPGSDTESEVIPTCHELITTDISFGAGGFTLVKAPADGSLILTKLYSQAEWTHTCWDAVCKKLCMAWWLGLIPEAQTKAINSLVWAMIILK